MIFKEILNKKPIDKLTAIVTSKNNDIKPEFKSSNHIGSSKPLPIRSTSLLRSKTRSTFRDLTGFKILRLTVLGLSETFWKQSARGLAWVVRCDCGRYEIRRTKSLLKIIYKKGVNAKGMMCTQCRRNNHYDVVLDESRRLELYEKIESIKKGWKR